MKLHNSLLIILLFIGCSVSAQKHKDQKYACGPDEIAFYGNDLIAYYDGKVVKGSAKYALNHDGLNLQFSSQANLDKFKNKPQEYLPAYNGWCAIALTNGSLVQPDFNHFKVQDGELLFFEVRAFFNGKTAWEKDPDINKIVADKKFKERFGKE